MPHPFQQTQFRLGVPQVHLLPPDEGKEVAFAGRSNAGKSSALNTLCHQRSLARVSRTPGRTQELNVFDIPAMPDRRLIDLPGLGFARVPAKQRNHWERLLQAYFSQRDSLVGTVLIMDIRHPMTPIDEQLLDWLLEGQVPLHIVLTKADKLSRNQSRTQLLYTQKILEDRGIETTLQTFSSTKKEGVTDLASLLIEWMR